MLTRGVSFTDWATYVGWIVDCENAVPWNKSFWLLVLCGLVITSVMLLIAFAAKRSKGALIMKAHSNESRSDQLLEEIRDRHDAVIFCGRAPLHNVAEDLY